MRLWSLHPEYLDAKGLVALWREGLLAQKVLSGQTNGYQNHPQLTRFRETEFPVEAIGTYLKGVLDEADKRQYQFDRTKIVSQRKDLCIQVTSGQIQYEYHHLLKKLEKRDEEKYLQLCGVKRVRLHPVFQLIEGDIEPWEKINKS